MITSGIYLNGIHRIVFAEHYSKRDPINMAWSDHFSDSSRWSRFFADDFSKDQNSLRISIKCIFIWLTYKICIITRRSLTLLSIYRHPAGISLGLQIAGLEQWPFCDRTALELEKSSSCTHAMNDCKHCGFCLTRLSTRESLYPAFSAKVYNLIHYE